MIVTLTANPSLDRTVELPGPLEPGQVQRAAAAHQEPGGKGVNIVRALTASGRPALAVLPGDPEDPVLAALTAADIPHRGMPLGAALRSNITLTEPDGVTTKINEPGPSLSASTQEELIELLLAQVSGASWVVLAGSLPPSVPDDFYARIIARIRRELGVAAPRIAVDASGAPAAAAVGAPETGMPDLIKPNAEELAELTGLPVTDAEPDLALKAAQSVVDSGVGAVLATLGAAGGLLATAAGTWRADGLTVTARSTVGAGDATLAGYLMAHTDGQDPAGCLRQAIAHGAAATSLPGSTMPTNRQTTPDAVTVTTVSAQRADGVPAARAPEGK